MQCAYAIINAFYAIVSWDAAVVIEALTPNSFQSAAFYIRIHIVLLFYWLCITATFCLCGANDNTIRRNVCKYSCIIVQMCDSKAIKIDRKMPLA